jgi:hypothetical protein
MCVSRWTQPVDFNGGLGSRVCVQRVGRPSAENVRCRYRIRDRTDRRKYSRARRFSRYTVRRKNYRSTNWRLTTNDGNDDLNHLCPFDTFYVGQEYDRLSNAGVEICKKKKKNVNMLKYRDLPRRVNHNIVLASRDGNARESFLSRRPSSVFVRTG